MKYRDVITLIEAEGRYFKRQSSSHMMYYHPTRPGVIVVAGGGKLNRDVPTSTLNKILRDAGLKRDGDVQ